MVTSWGQGKLKETQSQFFSPSVQACAGPGKVTGWGTYNGAAEFATWYATFFPSKNKVHANRPYYSRCTLFTLFTLSRCFFNKKKNNNPLGFIHLKCRIDDLAKYMFHDMAWTYYPRPGGVAGEWTVSSVENIATGEKTGAFTGVNLFDIGADNLISRA